MNRPLISVIVTTRNNEPTLDACLSSITSQTYQPIELMVVDNASHDNTKQIAAKYTDLVFDKGPERSAQRNFAVHKAKGTYVLIIDSDMELSENVVEACVQKIQEQPEVKSIIIPEESFGEGFWAQCKRLERSFYLGQDDIEAARFFDKQLYQTLGGYNENMTGAEDWDFAERMRQRALVARINDFIHHNEGHLKLGTALKKRFYYTRGFKQYYQSIDAPAPRSASSSVLRYYKLYLSQPDKLFKNPLVGLGVLFMKTCDFAAGALAYVTTSTKQDNA